MDAPVVGKMYGCTDGDRPQKATEHYLSRLYDQLFALKDNKEAQQELWLQEDATVRGEFNYCRWMYVAK